MHAPHAHAAQACSSSTCFTDDFLGAPSRQNRTRTTPRPTSTTTLDSYTAQEKYPRPSRPPVVLCRLSARTAASCSRSEKRRTNNTNTHTTLGPLNPLVGVSKELQHRGIVMLNYGAGSFAACSTQGACPRRKDGHATQTNAKRSPTL